MYGFPLSPDQASPFSIQWDHLFWFLSALTVFFSVLIFALVFVFAVKYRRRSKDEIPPQNEGNLPLELLWTIVPSIICIGLFIWSTKVFMVSQRPPANSTEIFVVGKQWMWKIQHPEGPREINELHIPVGEPVKLTMTSEDVIHDFGLPAFRVKKDVVPGIYSTEWIEPSKVGEYHLFCDQFCGMGHTQMAGTVVVLSQEDYARWLSSQMNTEPMSVTGARLFDQLACGSCHGTGPSSKGPALAGIYGTEVKLQNGKTEVVDDAFMRQAVLGPQPIVGYPALMPTFQGQVNEEEVLDLIAYIKSLGPGERKAAKQ